MTSGIVNASFSLPEWQAVEMIFFAPSASVFRISFHLDWQINNGFYNRPIMMCTEILVHSLGPRRGFWPVLQTDLTRIKFCQEGRLALVSQ